MDIIQENCRLCQKTLGTIPLEVELVEVVFKIAKIELNDLGETLPTGICLECKNKISEIDQYITEIQTINNFLRACLDKPTVETASNYLYQDLDQRRSETDTHACLVCSKTCNRLSTFKKHLKTHPEMYCRICNTFFETPAESINHNDCEDVKNITCSTKSEPDTDFTNNECNFQCIKCEQHFEDQKCYTTHLKTHNKYTCLEENCAKEFSTAYSLKMHNLAHEGKKSFLCVSCGKDFVSKKSLICHEKIHAPIKAHKCDQCNLSFSVRSNFRAHIKRYHEGVRYSCSRCPKEFLTKCNLDRHEKIHIGLKDFECEQCTAAFYTKKELIKHQRYHQGLRLHKCEECFKTFFERHHLIVHLRTHSGERPYVCKLPDCGKSFYDNQKLKRHQKSKHVSLLA
ncbi:unnamed protein product [Phyllotreta striolata]|uniref:C2H2-type domain-containing protein n=1 Tax=Phyllotreta striolata TaxID=444603 RepID=A0A9N9XN05_PHYSR|nr:unnamed protein product [Phyllotreta striolata]